LRTIDRDFAALQLVHAPNVASLVITSYNYSMKIPVRRVGNSLGIIIPKPVLEAWGVGEGDRLELTACGLRPAARPGLRHEALDELKRSIALAVVRQFTPREIRAQIVANLHRWSQQGAWVSAYDEWRDIATRADDGELFAAMLGRDDNALRLRQSMPFVGLLSQAEVRRLHEEAAG
jgi:antitoxin component of MazEF toxin-antitoxin module